MLAGVSLAVLVVAGILLGLLFTGGDDPARGQLAAPGRSGTVIGAAGAPTPTGTASAPASHPGPAAPAGSGATSPGRGGATPTAAGGSPSAGRTGANATDDPGGADDDGGGSASLDDLGLLVPSSTRPATVPAGYTAHRDGFGWSVALPSGWRTSGGGVRFTATAPSGYPDLLVETQTRAGPSSIGAWRDLEPAVRTTTSGYRRLAIDPADGGTGATSAAWEFTFTSGGRTIHVLDLGVVRNGHGYALRWRAPEDQWPASAAQFRTIVASFRPGS